MIDKAKADLIRDLLQQFNVLEAAGAGRVGHPDNDRRNELLGRTAGCRGPCRQDGHGARYSTQGGTGPPRCRMTTDERNTPVGQNHKEIRCGSSRRCVRRCRAGLALIRFPTLSMMLRSGPTAVGAAALWITRRKRYSRMWITHLIGVDPLIRRIALPSNRLLVLNQMPRHGHGQLVLSLRGFREDHRTAMRCLFRSLREHPPPGRRLCRRRLHKGAVSGRLTTGRARPSRLRRHLPTGH